MRAFLKFVMIFTLVGMLLGLSVTGALGFAAYQRWAGTLPSPDGLVNRQTFKTAQILDRNGKLLFELVDPQGGRRTVVALRDIPAALRQATVATEDADFYTNPGFDLRAMGRALFQNLTSDDKSGASTITQQLVRNVLLTTDERFSQDWRRKLKEIVLAYQVSQRYTKDQILQLYLNEIYYGNLAYGVEAAAQTYFGKPAKELSLAQCALIAGLGQSPNAYNPLVNPRAARARRDEVLGLMERQGYVDHQAAEAAKREDLGLKPRSADFQIKAPHFVNLIRERIEERYQGKEVYTSGLRITTSLDLDLQTIAEAAAQEHLATIRDLNANNAALVAIDPATGEVLAMLGSADFFDDKIDGQVNVALAARQPGSTLKPFVYLAGFQRGWAPATVIDDKATEFPGNYRPQNHDHQFHGRVSIRTALANSLNIPAVEMLQKVGVPSLLDIAHRFGITGLREPERYGLAVALGGGEVNLLDLVYAYTPFATGGTLNGRAVDPAAAGLRDREPVTILKVTDADGRVLDEWKPAPGKQVTTPQLAFLVSSVLSDDEARYITYGRHSDLELSRPAAAKTGTTDDFRDGWTVGYTPNLVAGVWVGNSNNAPMKNVFGSSGAGVIWHTFMERALKAKNLPVARFDPPPGVVRREVSALTGVEARGPGEPTVTDWFIENLLPPKPFDDALLAPAASPSPSPPPAAPAPAPPSPSPAPIASPVPASPVPPTASPAAAEPPPRPPAFLTAIAGSPVPIPGRPTAAAAPAASPAPPPGPPPAPNSATATPVPAAVPTRPAVPAAATPTLPSGPPTPTRPAAAASPAVPLPPPPPPPPVAPAATAVPLAPLATATPAGLLPSLPGFATPVPPPRPPAAAPVQTPAR